MAPRKKLSKFFSAFLDACFTQSKVGFTFSTSTQGFFFTVILVYVDDIIFTATSNNVLLFFISRTFCVLTPT